MREIDWVVVAVLTASAVFSCFAVYGMYAAFN